MDLIEIEKALRRDCAGADADEIRRSARAILRTGLSYEDRQVYATAFKNSKTGKVALKVFAGIEGLRIAALATGCYAGCTRHDPVIGDDGLPCAIRVTVRRRLLTGEVAEFSQVVYLPEYDTGQELWARMPVTMLGKVGEAGAIRMAFADVLAQVYEPGEFPADRDQEPARTQPPPSSAPVHPSRPAPARQADLPLSPVGTGQAGWWEALAPAEWERLRSSSVLLSRWRKDEKEKPAMQWLGIAPAMRLEILSIAADGGFGPQEVEE